MISLRVFLQEAKNNNNGLTLGPVPNIIIDIPFNGFIGSFITYQVVVIQGLPGKINFFNAGLAGHSRFPIKTFYGL